MPFAFHFLHLKLEFGFLKFYDFIYLFNKLLFINFIYKIYTNIYFKYYINFGNILNKYI